MNVLGIDIGGKTRNGFCLTNSKTEEIIEYSYITYDYKSTPLNHRFKILSEIERYMKNYQVDYVVFERINLFRGSGVSPLANIISLCKLQTTIIDNLSEKVKISDVAVKSWKSRILKNGNATKEDSINFVSLKYPDVNIKTSKGIKKTSEFVYNHDLCDAICISLYGCRNKDMLAKNLVNYR